MNTLNQKVSIAEKIGYSLGDCSANFVFQMMMIYQTKFYTDVFGLEGAVAGSVMLLARIVDAFVDPTVGILSDRTKSKCPLPSLLDGQMMRPLMYSGLFLIGPRNPSGKTSRLPQVFPPSFERTSQPVQSPTFNPIL